MKCEHCDQDLYISKCVPTSELNTTTVKMTNILVCTNQNCTIYCGPDTNHPKHIADTLVLTALKEA